MPTDTERLDFLQKLTDMEVYTGEVILRNSTTWGWRLHESETGYSDVRDAIDEAMMVAGQQ